MGQKTKQNILVQLIINTSPFLRLSTSPIRNESSGLLAYITCSKIFEYCPYPKVYCHSLNVVYWLNTVPIREFTGPSAKSDYAWDLPRANFSRQPLWTSTVCTRQVVIHPDRDTNRCQKKERGGLLNKQEKKKKTF